ncbi:MAG: hypothetical protein DSY46_01510 [Hydrogenimonas sp.]|nr:MAG: hypothetical protein DSY46_01510 [Hydrogenimonas sp.]
MGFFDKIFKSMKEPDKDTPEKRPVEFSAVSVTTENVPQALKDVARKYGVSVSMLDVRLTHLQTFIKLDKNDPEWRAITEDEWEEFNKPETLLNPDFQVKQSYDIDITQAKPEAWMKDLKLYLATNKERSRIICTIKAGSMILKTDALGKKLEALIENKMLRAGMLIRLFNIDYSKALDEITAKALVHKRYKFPEDVSFDVARCIASRPPIDDRLILHYKERDEQPKESDRIDYSKRGFIHAVEKGDLIIEYVKPQKGQPGRNCHGIFIPVNEPKERYRPDFRVSDKIEVEESDTHILYRAKRGGYIVFKNGFYDIEEQIEVSEVSFKKTGSIDAGVETEVKLRVRGRDALKDAIGVGVEVEATEVNVAGNVGASSIVKAEDVEIGGQTHQTSSIYAERAKVNVLRGLLKATETAHVKRLEGGFVEARKVIVEHVIGGIIKAFEVRVGTIASNAKILAANEIVINDMSGENNKLIINAARINAYRNEIHQLQEETRFLNGEIKKLEAKKAEYMRIRKESELAVATLKQKIVEDSKKGIQPKPAFITKIKQFQQLLENIDGLKEQIRDTKTKLREVEQKLLALQELTLHAKIVNHGKWGDYTTIEFHLLHPKRILEYHPKTGEKKQQVTLKKSDDGKFEIVVKEVDE